MLQCFLFKDFKCPTCHLGFIEKVEEQQTPEEPDDDMDFPNDNFLVRYYYILIILFFK